jgi:hypothetical protein
MVQNGLKFMVSRMQWFKTAQNSWFQECNDSKRLKIHGFKNAMVQK